MYAKINRCLLICPFYGGCPHFGESVKRGSTVPPSGKGSSFLSPWAWPTAPWLRIHTDFAGPIFGKMLLVVTDSHSKWLEVCVMTSKTAGRTMAALRDMFTRHGIPEQLVSDINPLPTNDAHMRHGLSISHKNLYGGFNTRRYTSVHGFCFF